VPVAPLNSLVEAIASLSLSIGRTGALIASNKMCARHRHWPNRKWNYAGICFKFAHEFCYERIGILHGIMIGEIKAIEASFTDLQQSAGDQPVPPSSGT